MEKQFYKNYLKKAFVLLLVFVLALPLVSIAEIKSHTEQEISSLETKRLRPRPFNGWKSENGKWYYYIDGDKQSGWLYLSDGTYYLDPNDDGARVSGRQKIRGRFYYFNSNNNDRMFSGWTLFFGNVYRYYQSNGVMATGLALADGVMHYFDANGYWKGRAQGWVQENGKWYFYVKGVKEKGRIFNVGNYYFLDKTTGEMRTSWIKDGEDWYFAFNNGTLATNITELGGKTHFFKSYGPWIGTNGWQEKNGKWYYFEDGKKAKGWWNVEGNTYFFDETDDCAMLTGWNTIEGEEFYFASSGIRAASELIDFGAGGKFYFYPSGFARRTLGWVSENGAWYFKWTDGTIERNRSLYFRGTMYYFGSDGKMQTGWFTTPDGRGYALPSGTMLFGTTQLIDGVSYYFDDDGMATPAEGWKQENGKWYFYVNGVKKTGELYYNGGNYYMNDDGSMYTGWKILEGSLFQEYYKESGAKAENETIVIDGVSCKFDSYGWYLRQGWFYSNIYNAWLYFSDSTYPSTGWLDISGVKYYLGEDGTMRTGWLEIDTALYYFTSSGNMLTGTVWVEGKLCVFENNGMFYDYYKGWREENGKWYYYKNGERHIGWLELGANWYYMFSDGTMATGTVNAGGVMHVFDSNGVWQHAL